MQHQYHSQCRTRIRHQCTYCRASELNVAHRFGKKHPRFWPKEDARQSLRLLPGWVNPVRACPPTPELFCSKVLLCRRTSISSTVFPSPHSMAEDCILLEIHSKPNQCHPTKASKCVPFFVWEADVPILLGIPSQMIDSHDACTIHAMQCSKRCRHGRCPPIDNRKLLCTI